MSDETRFDFEDITESDEDLDFDNLVKCPNCGNPIPHNAILCLYCGRSTSSRRAKPVWFILVALIIIISFIIWIFK